MVTKEQRRRRLARQHWERQQVRRATRRRRARRNAVVVAVVLGVLAVAAVVYLVFFLLRGDNSSASASARPGTSAGIGVLAAPPATPGPGYILGSGTDRPRHGEQRVEPGQPGPAGPVGGEKPGAERFLTGYGDSSPFDHGEAGTERAVSSVIGKDVKVTTT
ncbi:hypothetical protein [Actinopolymorpha singaporensis]|uniref:Uncharacterized protein n=1 Tax=Actinopolymorpha singaporensis TaxID=117157 RepID=A0A1H1VJ55_9ACTN|nr:hypothetical protein [Actinopolymorpha singaporensis]SDS84099.1 hypothetical protein SAMN04489717_4067 [Actinopolymorpha singaporensis]